MTAYSLINLCCLDTIRKEFHRKDLYIDASGLISLSPAENAIVIDLLHNYFAIPLLILSSSIKTHQYIKNNALENGTEIMNAEYTVGSSNETSALQLGAWPTILSQEPTESTILDLLLLHTTYSLLPKSDASLILLSNKSTLLEHVQLFDYKSTIRAVFHAGNIAFARGELAQYSAQSNLQKYYDSSSQASLLPATLSIGLLEDYSLDSIEDAINDLRNGKFVIVVDNEDRENEGDLVIAAQDMTDEKMAFMIKHTGGIICVPATASRLKELALPMMVEENQDSLKTAYTVTLDYKHGTTTGISAHDRAATVRAIADSSKGANDFNRPGHTLPLRYVEGGVLSRVGHTEASIDLCVLAGKQPCSVISEVVSQMDAGVGMARRDELFLMKHTWGLKMVSIASLVAYRTGCPTLPNFTK